MTETGHSPSIVAGGDDGAINGIVRAHSLASSQGGDSLASSQGGALAPAFAL